MLAGVPLFLTDRATTLDRFPATRPILDGSRFEAAACLPLTDHEGEPVGYLAAHYTGRHEFGAAEAASLRWVAAACSGSAARLLGVRGAPVLPAEGSPATDEPVSAVRAASAAGSWDEDRLRDELEGLRTAMRSRAVIEQAKGMLMQRYDLSADASWQVLRRLSAESNTKLRELARRLVTGETVAGLSSRFVGEAAAADENGEGRR
jgi:hypothetical protein